MKSQISSLWGTWWARYGFLTILVLILVFIFRVSILQNIGEFLSPEDEVTQVDALFVLGGNSLDRGAEAAKLYKDGVSAKLVCSGGNIPSVLKAINEPQFELEITRTLLLNAGVSANHIDVLTTATSTWEEAQEIVDYCDTHEIERAMIVSSKFHLRRVRGVFTDMFEDRDTELFFHGAPSSDYDESEWWKSEGGLIMVNNEYVKLFYYWLKY